jgi:hypothetical protein
MRARRISVPVFVLGGWALVACRPGEPPAAQVDAAVAPLPPPPAVVGDAGAADGSAKVASGAPPPTASSEGADAGVDPGTLPQTRDKPEAKGAAFDARVAALWDAIVHDDPERGMPFFFPVKAYEQVKAVGDPASDWRRRLVSAYKRDIHGLHKRLGERAADAKLLRAEVPDLAKWMDPGDEYNKLGYWRVYGTRLVYEVNGKERTFEISSLISWRGEWYVVHLTGFK